MILGNAGQVVDCVAFLKSHFPSQYAGNAGQVVDCVAFLKENYHDAHVVVQMPVDGSDADVGAYCSRVVSEEGV